MTSYSPALDAGNSTYSTSAGLTKDVAGRARVDGTSVDIGAYERVDSDPTSARSTSDCHNDFYIDVIYDADKEMNTDKDLGDSKLCWAAAASNALWFTQWGQIDGREDEEEVFHDVFQAKFENEGGNAHDAYCWFLDGSGYNSVSGGRYYSKALTNGETANSYVKSYKLQDVSSVVAMTEELRSGVGVAISIAWFKNYNYTKENRVDGHALSVYGYSYNPQLLPTDPGYITKLYVADSNDYGKLSGRRDRKLQTLNLVWNNNLYCYVVDNYQVKSGVLPVLEEAFVIAPRPVKYDPNAANVENLYFFEKFTAAPTFSIECDGLTSLANNKEATLSFSFLSNAAISSGVKYEVFIDDASYGVFSTRAIEPGQNTLSRSLGYLASGSHVVRVALDSEGAIEESNEQDNFYAITIDVDKVELRPLETASTVVTTSEDVVNAFDGAISLREALAYATAGDVITFDPSLAGKTITLSAGQLEISKSVTIDASALWGARNDKPGITIDANRRSRVFCVDENLTVSFNGLAITGGYAEEEGRRGGGVY
ncbi:MAG: hypothetical protein II655_00150, partial [Thermoguttaceae bacterium]|nr:hypothetical protein [Thermoguttaceae bacterium]